MVEFQKSIVSMQRVSDRKAIEKRNSTKKFREHQDGDTLFGGVEAFRIIKRGFSPASSFQVKGS